MTITETELLAMFNEIGPRLNAEIVTLAKARDAADNFAERCHYQQLKKRVGDALEKLYACKRRIEAHAKARGN